MTVRGADTGSSGAPRAEGHLEEVSVGTSRLAVVAQEGEAGGSVGVLWGAGGGRASGEVGGECWACWC